MKKYLKLKFLLVAMLLQACLYAQVNFIFNASAYGRDMRGLSTVQLINTSAQTYTGNLEIEVKNLSGTGTVVKIFIQGVNVSPGNNVVPSSKFGTAAVSYVGSNESNYIRQTNMMPEGELEYCFKFTVTSKNNANEVYENCFEGTNILATPLQLVTPDNGERSCERRPRFTWQPPMPLSAGMSYTLKLVEVKTGQSQSEALLVNTPVIFQTNIKGFVLPYPTGSPDLKENTTYAWQVIANDRGRQSVSEVWEFAIQCTKEDTQTGSFRELKAQDDGGFLSTGATLRFALYNPYIQGPLKYSITDLQRPDTKLKGLPSIELQKGDNNISIDLNKVAGIEDGNEYLLTVMLPDGKKVAVRFKYDDNNE